jgi:hypothetical protein
MWLDERGSDVLGLAECRRLMAFGVKAGLHGHLATCEAGDVAVVPVDYAMNGNDIVILIGEGLFGRVRNQRVAFQVDGTDGSAALTGEPSRPWSVLVRGFAVEEVDTQLRSRPVPQVVEAGDRLVRIRADVVTGRRLGAPAASGVAIDREAITPSPGEKRSPLDPPP